MCSSQPADTYVRTYVRNFCCTTHKMCFIKHSATDLIITSRLKLSSYIYNHGGAAVYTYYIPTQLHFFVLGIYAQIYIRVTFIKKHVRYM